MCGITGLSNSLGVDTDVLNKMSEALIHRGPDNFGSFVSQDKKVGFAHRRLSIIDTSSSGNQPMSNEDSTIWITFNGEIYNFSSLKEELVQLGHIFKSNSDTEVIIHGYEEWGFECLDRLEGMFAFAIYDSVKEIIFFARDRFGIKPLYYCLLDDNVFAFASELKALAEHSLFNRSIDWTAVKDYFQYRYVPSPKTIWKNTYKLKHSHYGIFDINNTEIRIDQYYNLADVLRQKPSSSIEEVESLLDQAVKSHLISDVEVGTFLSGGVDSSTICAYARDYNENMKSFSIGFEPSTYSELEYSGKMAEYLSTDHLTEVISDIDDSIIKKYIDTYDEPLADSSCIPTLLLCEMTSRHLKVALSGDGGDEVFSGYSWYSEYLDELKNYQSGLLNSVKSLFGFETSVLPDFEDRYNKILLNRFNKNIFKQMFSDEIYTKAFSDDGELMEKFISPDFKNVRAVQYVDMNTFLADDILPKVDRASMAFSLEVRVPFLDHKLVEAVWRLPESDFSTLAYNKPVLKKIARNKIPQEIISRKKRGFSAPVQHWKGFDKIPDILLNGVLVKEGIIKKEFLIKVKENRVVNSSGIIWMIYVFEKWYEKWAK